jgi:hypothetical protein
LFRPPWIGGSVNREHSLLEEIPSVFVGNGRSFCKKASAVNRRKKESSECSRFCCASQKETEDGSLSPPRGFALAANVRRRRMHLTNLAAERSSAS